MELILLICFLFGYFFYFKSPIQRSISQETLVHFYSLDFKERFALFSTVYPMLSDALFRKLWIACNDPNYLVRAAAIHDVLMVSDSQTYALIQDTIVNFVHARQASESIEHDIETNESKESEVSEGLKES